MSLSLRSIEALESLQEVTKRGYDSLRDAVNKLTTSKGELASAVKKTETIAEKIVFSAKEAKTPKKSVISETINPILNKLKPKQKGERRGQDPISVVNKLGTVGDKLRSGSKAFSKSIAGFAGIVKSLLNIKNLLLLIPLALAGLAAYAFKHWDDIKEKASAIWKDVKYDNIKTIVTLKEKWNKLVDTVFDYVEEVTNYVKNNWKAILIDIKDGLIAYVKWWTSKYTAMMAAAWKGIKDFWKEASGIVTDIWKLFKEQFPFLQKLEDSIKDVWETIKTDAEDVWKSTKQIAKDVWESTGKVAKDVWETVKPLAESAWDIVEPIVKPVWNAIEGVAKDVWGKIETIALGVWDILKTRLGNIFSDLAANLKNLFSNIPIIGKFFQKDSNSMRDALKFDTDTTNVPSSFDNYLKTKARIESNYGKHPDTYKGKHQGLMQMGPAERKKYGVTDVRNYGQQIRGGADLDIDNAKELVKAGVPLSPANLYGAWQQGAAGFISIWKKARAGEKLTDASAIRNAKNNKLRSVYASDTLSDLRTLYREEDKASKNDDVDIDFSKGTLYLKQGLSKVIPDHSKGLEVPKKKAEPELFKQKRTKPEIRREEKQAPVVIQTTPQVQKQTSSVQSGIEKIPTYNNELGLAVTTSGMMR